MRATVLLFASLFFAPAASHAGPVLQTAPFEVIHDVRTHERSMADKRYSVWTDKDSEVAGMLREFGLEAKAQPLKEGHIMAVFLHDNITEDLTAMVYNKTSRDMFADYADSGIEFKLKAPPPGRKYSHLTVVIFAPVVTPNHLGIRSMVTGGLSEKKE